MIDSYGAARDSLARPRRPRAGGTMIDSYGARDSSLVPAGPVPVER